MFHGSQSEPVFLHTPVCHPVLCDDVLRVELCITHLLHVGANTVMQLINQLIN